MYTYTHTPLIKIHLHRGCKISKAREINSCLLHSSWRHDEQYCTQHESEVVSQAVVVVVFLFFTFQWVKVFDVSSDNKAEKWGVWAMRPFRVYCHRTKGKQNVLRFGMRRQNKQTPRKQFWKAREVERFLELLATMS